MPDKMSATKYQSQPVPMYFFVENCANQIAQFDEGDDAGLLACIKQQTKLNNPIRVYYEPAKQRRAVAHEER